MIFFPPPPPPLHTTRLHIEANLLHGHLGSLYRCRVLTEESESRVASFTYSWIVIVAAAATATSTTTATVVTTAAVRIIHQLSYKE